MTDAAQAGPKKMAVVSDLAGYGRCALTLAIPVLSALGVQCCPVPTAILSNHAGYPSCYLDDYTDRMEPYIAQWKKLGFSVDGIMTGFLGSARQAGIVTDFIRSFQKPGSLLLVDPAMGDHGRLYRVCDSSLCDAMRELVQHADLITPNLTEACALTQTPYRDTGWSRRRLADLTWKLLLMGAGAVVLTGVVKGNLVVNVIHEKGKEPVFQTAHYESGARHGTGDVFASVLGGSVLNGVPLEEAARRAAAFTRKCVERSVRFGIPEAEGLCVEACLSYLIRQPEKRTAARLGEENPARLGEEKGLFTS